MQLLSRHAWLEAHSKSEEQPTGAGSSVGGSYISGTFWYSMTIIHYVSFNLLMSIVLTKAVHASRLAEMANCVNLMGLKTTS